MIFHKSSDSSPKSWLLFAFLVLSVETQLFLSPAPARAGEDVILAPVRGVGDYTHVFLSESIEKTALWLDTFLGGEEAYEGNTGSLIQAGTRTVFSQYGGVKSESSVRARLVLPRTQERLNLVLQSDAEEEVESKDTALDGDLIPVEKVSGFAAALEGIFVETSQWRAAIRGGIKTKIPPDAFVRFDLRRRWHPENAGRITIDEKAYWYAVEGYVNKLRLYWDIPGGDGLLFRPSAGATWKWKEPGYRWDGGLGVFQRMSEIDVLAYNARLNGEGDGYVRTNAYVISAELRHKLYKNWVYAGVGPGFSWKRELDFRPEAFLAVRLDLIFSKKLSDEGKMSEEGLEPPSMEIGTPPVQQ
ncbi:hypothetical protein EPN96_06815 [bacterium]|nr:MAG: hypothetical protein EPN96_06815 [bacterium]